MQLSQSTISKFGLGTPEAAPGNPSTHMPVQGVGSNILYNNNPSGTAVYDPNADGGFLKDINTGQEIRPNSSTVFGYKAPKQIATAKLNTSGVRAPSNPFSNKPAASSSFNSGVASSKPNITRTNVPTKSSITPVGPIKIPNYTGATPTSAPSNNLGGRVSSGSGVQKPSNNSPTKITPAMQTAANNIGNLLKNILNNALFGRR
jgi:hypothetical protein